MRRAARLAARETTDVLMRQGFVNGRGFKLLGIARGRWWGLGFVFLRNFFLIP